MPLRYLPSKIYGIAEEKQGKKTRKGGIWALQGRTRRNQLSLVGAKSAGAAGWLQNWPPREGREPPGLETLFPSAGVGDCAPQEPLQPSRVPSSPPGPLQPSLSCRQAQEPSFPQHSSPGVHPSLGKATRGSHGAIVGTRVTQSSERPEGLPGVHRRWQSPGRFFPIKPRLSLKLQPAGSPALCQNSPASLSGCKSLPAEHPGQQIGPNFTPESQLVQIWPGNYCVIRCCCCLRADEAPKPSLRAVAAV